MVDPAAASAAFWDLKASEVMKFAASLVSALAWPVSAFLIVSLFKKEIIERIPKLSELTLPGGFSAKFKEGLAKVEAQLNETHGVAVPEGVSANAQVGDVSASGATPRQERAPDPIEEKDEVALRANPTGVVMESWKELEQMLRFFAIEKLGPKAAKYAGPSLVNALQREGLIPEFEAKSLWDLVSLRNLAAHSSSRAISEDEAERFSRLASAIARGYKERMRDRLKPSFERDFPD